MAAKFFSPNDWPIFDNWLMVAQKEFRFVALKDGKDLTCRSTRHLRIVELTDSSDKAGKEIAEMEMDRICSQNPLTAEEACRENLKHTLPKMTDFTIWRLKQQNSRLFAIIGRSPGEATVKAYRKRSEKARLSVTVAKTITVPAVFHAVRHLEHGKKPFTPHSRTIDEQATRFALALANGILAQAAVEFEVHKYGFADIESDLGPMIDIRKEDKPGVVAIRALRDTSVEPNVFIVGRVLNNSGTEGTAFDDRDVIIDNHEGAYDFARTLAHELGHVLGLGHVWPDPKKKKIVKRKGNITTYHQPPTNNLMGPGEEEGLNKTQITAMRKRALKLAKKRSR